MESISNNSKVAEDKGGVAKKLEDITIHIIDVNDGLIKVIDESGENLCTILENDEPNCFMLTSYNAAMYRCLSFYEIKPLMYAEALFYGVFLDKGCAYARSGDIKNVRAHCSHIGILKAHKNSNVSCCKVDTGSVTLLVSAVTEIPIRKLLALGTVHIVRANFLRLMSLADMNRFKIQLDNVNNEVIHMLADTKANIT